jgi:DNA-binding NarL/FixJ family response regulator
MPGWEIVAAARTVREAEHLVREVRPDVLICEADMGAGSGIDLCRWALQASRETSVIILSYRDEPALARPAADSGARAYLLKSSPPGELRAGLERAMTGCWVLDHRTGRSRRPGPGVDLAAVSGLSQREREVLEHVLAGLGNRAIAERLCITEETVKSHVKSILRKLGARDRTHAVALALGMAEQPGRPRPVQPGAAGSAR